MAYPKIWFLRHGQTEWNAEGRIQGQLESKLSPLGIEHAQQQASLMAPILAQGPTCIVSPLGRAQQTARIALGGQPYTTDARLAEAQAGVFQGMTREEVEAEYPEIYAANPLSLDLFCAAPKGEGYAAFQARIEAFLNGLSEPTVVVAHGLWGQVLRGLICGLSRAEMAALPNEQGCIYELSQGREQVLRQEENSQV
ncbi:histidine phosphatase family protein [Phaeobacter gallaeciensis]|uniref:Fructose-2,6-bisphosphatase n=1 Tax=Phaeobacter gallaeciensis TaxID=60890 RepID=A0AAC9Z8G5_9RHOB|nr:Fructose-2,6-bisphosphatase [Phaeobacter gallaeciensis DSM 26640]ATE92385.1 Fructose-2,6-bisphosphatase [Phaeobacter gallaeciensis]ATE97793.1 Fructose-2,6-bisphosphatase [Phaeobacter gallaeciensis]ATF01050.1 Fructose-2,6-bisphosphatase [Phaeobacter gallaeciensis]ATF05430.1 Fructose-2,6-bisphosphatase [Phaeobacter gallaeciensis]